MLFSTLAFSARIGMRRPVAAGMINTKMASTTSGVSSQSQISSLNQIQGPVQQQRGISTWKDFHKSKLGNYPVPPETYVWWKNRYQVPGGQVMQEVSMFQQKIMWQYFWNNPGKWYWRISQHVWSVWIPFLTWWVFVVRATMYDAEEMYRDTQWW